MNRYELKSDNLKTSAILLLGVRLTHTSWEAE